MEEEEDPTEAKPDSGSGTTPIPSSNTNNANNNNSNNNNNNNSKTCVTTCATDSDCANSCPATQGATACCDGATKTCFNSQDAVCPVTDGDSGAPPAY